MPVKNCKKTKQTNAQLRYNRRRVAAREKLYKKINEDYIKMRLKHIDKVHIIKVLQEKYDLCKKTIYNALNFREINKRIRATLASDPLQIAKAGQGTSERCSTVLFLILQPNQSLTHSGKNASINNSSCK